MGIDDEEEQDQQVSSRRSNQKRQDQENRSNKKRKNKKTTFSVEVLPDSGNTAASTPITAYFPSGYNPSTENEAGIGISAYRHQRYGNRVQLVVNPGGDGGGNLQFVGASYEGEAAAGPQLCSYVLGVVDKEKQTIRMVPVAANKILRMEPRIIGRRSAQPTEGVEEKVADRRYLTNLHGTKKDQKKDTKFRTLREQKRETSVGQDVVSQKNDPEGDKGAHDDGNKAEHRNIPPYDLSATTPDRAYPLEKIILKHERGQLLDILDIVNSEENFALKTSFWHDSGYPRFVSNRVHKVIESKNEEEKTSLACILSYITHLIKFLLMPRQERSAAAIHSGGRHNIPNILCKKLTTLFYDSESKGIPTDKRELLIEYILVLTLHADGFKSDPSDIARDLQMKAEALAPYYLQLGCKRTKGCMTLPLPLTVLDLKKRSRKRR